MDESVVGDEFPQITATSSCWVREWERVRSSPEVPNYHPKIWALPCGVDMCVVRVFRQRRKVYTACTLGARERQGFRGHGCAFEQKLEMRVFKWFHLTIRTGHAFVGRWVRDGQGLS